MLSAAPVISSRPVRCRGCRCRSPEPPDHPVADGGGKFVDVDVEHAVAGGVQLPRTRASYRVRHSTDSGDDTVDVRTDPRSPRRISVHTDSGGIAVRYR